MELKVAKTSMFSWFGLFTNVFMMIITQKIIALTDLHSSQLLATDSVSIAYLLAFSLSY